MVYLVGSDVPMGGSLSHTPPPAMIISGPPSLSVDNDAFIPLIFVVMSTLSGAHLNSSEVLPKDVEASEWDVDVPSYPPAVKSPAKRQKE